MSEVRRAQRDIATATAEGAGAGGAVGLLAGAVLGVYFVAGSGNKSGDPTDYLVGAMLGSLTFIIAGMAVGAIVGWIGQRRRQRSKCDN